MGELFIIIIIILGIGSAVSSIYIYGYTRGSSGRRAAVKAAELSAHEFIRNKELEMENQLNSHNLALEMIINSNSQQYPWLASIYSDFLFTIDQKTASYLATKPHPAIKSSEVVKMISQEKRDLQKECKLLEYQIRCYETFFPWLEEFKELPPLLAYDIVQNNESDDDAAITQHWLSPEEYTKLPDTRKFQIALDRYCQRPKTNWQIGIEYERYVGYLLEIDGYTVKYIGATFGLHDLGRDIIATNNEEVLIIQCKRWAQEKQIHEKHVFQLYGSLISWIIENPGQSARGIIYSTTELSETAYKYANYLNISVVIKAYNEYPLIKCNIGHNGERIYHLPFDQQYDRLYITPKKGDCYVSTVLEAEKYGFRRAYRWKGNLSQ